MPPAPPDFAAEWRPPRPGPSRGAFPVRVSSAATRWSSRHCPLETGEWFSSFILSPQGQKADEFPPKFALSKLSLEIILSGPTIIQWGSLSHTGIPLPHASISSPARPIFETGDQVAGPSGGVAKACDVRRALDDMACPTALTACACLCPGGPPPRGLDQGWRAVLMTSIEDIPYFLNVCIGIQYSTR